MSNQEINVFDYLVIVKGLIEDDLVDMVENGEDLRSLMSDEDWNEFYKEN